ncbi:LysM peptidoglycan-binding domain-containing protein [Desulfallas sp. Bu1-1]|uniref:LysM peptidoglycan-binding domain-containing protein n=1 Tax=Desulfallas sp. Bu1-1 TaxID=2787620 RepID=UPI001A9A723E|nr:LysM peptidoglycan-binding domain-containing protein [Desulfallas sp. Bu1-1]
MFFGSVASASDYTVCAGDSLWKISRQFGISIDHIKRLNNLTSDTIYAGQTLRLDAGYSVSRGAVNRNTNIDFEKTGNESGKPRENTSQPRVYVVQPGDNPYTIAQKFGIPVSLLLKNNHLDEGDLIYPGQQMLITGYTPQDQTPDQTTDTNASTSTGYGQLIDWFTKGRTLLKAGDIFSIVDIGTKKQFKVKMLGGSNHSDVEPLTKEDTATMLQVFGSWGWTPRPVVIVKDGIKIAGSLSGKPHSIDTIADNNVNGHFDLYLYNSQPHGSGISRSYVQQHRDAVMKAAGENQGSTGTASTTETKPPTR